MEYMVVLLLKHGIMGSFSNFLIYIYHNKLMHPMRDDESRYTNLDRRPGLDYLFLRECAELRKASDWLKITWM